MKERFKFNKERRFKLWIG